MLRKFLLQNRKTINGTNKRTFSSLTKRQVLKQNGKPHNAESSKRFYSSTGSSGNGTKLNSTILNYPTEDVLSIGLSILALKFAYDFVYGEKKKEEEPKVEEPKIDHNKEDSKLEEPKVGEEAKEVSEIESIEAKADFEENPTEEPKAEEADSAESEKAASEETAAEAEPVKGDEETKAESSNEDSEESKDTPSADAISEGAIDASAAGPAYNPETGEINWDCPCLGGMAHGPCGEEFKDAFSCFIYSEAEPKGVDCIEKFQGMQECFKKHPEIYAEQLKDEEAGAVPATSDEDAAATPAGEEVVSVDVIEEVINEQVVPVVDEIVTEEIIPVVEEKIVPVVEEKIVPAVEKIVDANITPASEDAVVFEEPETIDELVEEGLPINAED